MRTQAVPRLDKENPIYWIVARNEHEKQPVVRVGNNSYFSGLYVDGDGLLAKVAPDLRNEDLKPQCKCCTHSFNGEPLIAKFEEKP